MTLIKTFDEFKKPPVIDEARRVEKISAANAQKGELKRWNVVIRSGEEDTADLSNPYTTILRELSQDSDFKNWINGSSPVKDPVQGTDVTISNRNLLAVINLGVQNKTNLIGQKVFKGQVAFLPYATAQLRTGLTTGMWVTYDVTKVPHRGEVVDSSNVKLVAWDEQDLPKLKVIDNKDKGIFNNRIEAIYKKDGSNIPEYLVSPAYVEENGAPDGIYKAAPNAAAGGGVTTTTTTAAPGTTGVTATTIKTGLKSNNLFSQDVKDLQNKILANGGDAAAKIKAVGGADGKYGNATATAIGILTGKPAVPVIDITQDIADKLNTILKDVKVEAPVVKPDTTKKKKQASADPGF